MIKKKLKIKKSSCLLKEKLALLKNCNEQERHRYIALVPFACMTVDNWISVNRIIKIIVLTWKSCWFILIFVLNETLHLLSVLLYTYYQFQYLITTCLCLVEIYQEIFQSNSFNGNDLMVLFNHSHKKRKDSLETLSENVCWELLKF